MPIEMPIEMPKIKPFPQRAQPPLPFFSFPSHSENISYFSPPNDPEYSHCDGSAQHQFLFYPSKKLESFMQEGHDILVCPHAYQTP